LEKSVNELSPSAVQKELAKVRADLDAATANLSSQERAAIESKIRPRRLPPPQKWPEAEPAKVAVRDEDAEQAQLFDDQHPKQPTAGRRVVFKQRAKVPQSKKGRKRKQAATAPTLLSISDERID
jgi:hypothetical protein